MLASARVCGPTQLGDSDEPSSEQGLIFLLSYRDVRGWCFIAGINVAFDSWALRTGLIFNG